MAKVKKKNIVLFLGCLFLLASCTWGEKHAKDTDISNLKNEIRCEKCDDLGPFHFDIKTLDEPTRIIIEQASADFKAVISGHPPKFAKVQSEMLDGGTGIYKGNGYKMTVYNRLATFGKIDGYFYGPVLKFENPKMVIAENLDISHVEFYSFEELKKLTHGQ